MQQGCELPTLPIQQQQLQQRQHHQINDATVVSRVSNKHKLSVQSAAEEPIARQNLTPRCHGYRSEHRRFSQL